MIQSLRGLRRLEVLSSHYQSRIASYFGFCMSFTIVYVRILLVVAVPWCVTKKWLCHGVLLGKSTSALLLSWFC